MQNKWPTFPQPSRQRAAGISAEILTALAPLEDLAGTAGLCVLRDPGRPLGHLVLGAGELDVELLLVDGLPERPHGALQLLPHLLPHAVHVAGV